MLLLLPLDRKIDWKKPPLATLALVLANCFIFFFIQGSDDERWRAAADHYFSTALPKLELPAYIDELEQRGETELVTAAREALGKDAVDARAWWLLVAMQGDREFVSKLARQAIITVDHPQFEAWKVARSEFELRYQRIVTPAYAFHYGEPVTYLTSMFLHGSFMHLLGNMVFLLIVGFTVERILGSGQFLVSYLIGGLLAVGLWAVVHGDLGLLGASGAISAVMGMYSILFGLRKIRFFYLVLFYFDFVKAPALILLPLWLANEFYGLYAGYEGIGYIAHIGGFAGGALTAFVQTRILHTADVDYLEKPAREEQRARGYEQAMNLMGALKFDQAKTILFDLLRQNPTDGTVLSQLYAITRARPESDEYHGVAMRILELDTEDPATLRLMNDTFSDYSEQAKPAMRLVPEALAGLAKRFARGAHIAMAERIVLFLIRKLPTLAPLPDALFDLTEGFRRNRQEKKYQQYLRMLVQNYPNSDAAQRARRGFRS